MKITEANYVKSEFLERVLARSLTRKIYLQKYRGFLYCTEQECPALLSFVERKKSDTKYFRTWSKSKHKNGCPNEVSYDEIKNGNKKIHKEKKYNISDKHIKDKLKRAYEELLSQNRERVSPKGKSLGNHTDKNEGEESTGDAALFDEGVDINGKRQPYILTRSYDKLDEADFERVRCVTGLVTGISIFENHAYINLTGKNERQRVKLYYSEYFKANYPNEFARLHILKHHIVSAKKIGELIICCCVGQVRKVKTGFNIHPDRPIGITLNGLNQYEIENKYFNLY